MASAPPPEWVLLPAAAKLYMRPAATAVLPRADDSQYSGGFDAYTSVRKVRELPSGWTEVETAADRMQHCYDGVATFRIRLYVRSESIAPVLAQPTTLRFSDGSVLELLPGTPVQPGSEPGRHLVIADGLGFSVVLPESAIGRAYKPARHTPLRYDDHLKSLPERIAYDSGRKVQVIDEHSFHYKAKDGLLTAHGRCGDYLLHYLADSKAPMASIFGRDSALGSDAPRYLPANTRLHWRDGSVAGRLAKDQQAPFEQESCFRHRLGKTALLLCANKADIADVGAALEEAIEKEKRRQD